MPHTSLLHFSCVDDACINYYSLFTCSKDFKARIRGTTRLSPKMAYPLYKIIFTKVASTSKSHKSCLFVEFRDRKNFLIASFKEGQR